MSFFIYFFLLLLGLLIFQQRRKGQKNQAKTVLKLSSLTLNILWAIFWIVPLITLIPNALNTFTDNGETSFETALPIHFQVNLHEQDPDVTIDTDSQVEITNISEADGNIVFQTKSVRLQVLGFLKEILDAAVALFIVFQLRKIVDKIRKGKPFMEENLGRIRKIAYAILLYQLTKGFYIFTTSSIVATEFYMSIYMPEVIVQPVWEFFNLSLIGFVLVILVIEHAFREGLELQEEKDLTI